MDWADWLQGIGGLANWSLNQAHGPHPGQHQSTEPVLKANGKDLGYHQQKLQSFATGQRA